MTDFVSTVAIWRRECDISAHHFFSAAFCQPTLQCDLHDEEACLYDEEAEDRRCFARQSR
jgi:hypothetical protein